MSYQSFEKLEIWKKACQLSVSVYIELKECKDYSFKDQMQRSSISIASNIAEGAERGSIKEYIRFLHIAKGSAAELRTQLYIADKVGIISSGKRVEFCESLISISKMTHSLIKSLSLNLKS
jgi:four helix bundle protein